MIRDSIPKFLPSTTEKIGETKSGEGNFGGALYTSKTVGTGQLFLLLGGIGSGKTTFQKRFQLTVGKRTLEERSIWFSIDFLQAPLNSHDLEDFVWQTIITELRQKYSDKNFETRANIETAYKYEITNLHQTVLFNVDPSSPAYKGKLSEQLGIWQKNTSTYVPKLLGVIKKQEKLNITLFIDNVDQLSPEYQSKIFLLAERITRVIGSITIIALREESYYTASVRKIFTAYINRQFHIASPPFRIMIAKRIRYFLHLVENSKQLPPEINQIKPSERKKICDFLRIVENSIFEQNRNIARFIDTLCFGNMRLALQMFSLFLTSGVTEVDKILRIYNREGVYFVAFHEFLKSIMLEDRYYYKDARSPIINLFDCGAEKNSSHFTSIRLLELLDAHRTEYTTEGEGFIEISMTSALFENLFNNKEDVIRSLRRLVKSQLVETNTKATDTIENATHIRINSAGRYYLRYLKNSFTYLDLIIQDIPFDDEQLMHEMAQSVKQVGNKGDKDDDKIQRMEERFRRVDKLLNYLQKEEEFEVKQFALGEIKDSPLTKPIMKELMRQYSKQRESIGKRVKENREKYAEDAIFAENDDNFDVSEEGVAE